VLDSIEKEVGAGGCLIDFHSCDLFPESWIDLVVVLQTDHSILWNRLEARYPSTTPAKTLFRMRLICASGYALNKIQENNEAEIMQVVLSEAQESYKEEVIVVLQNDNVEQQEENSERIVQWLKEWVARNP
jgi:adenylate kinase